MDYSSSGFPREQALGVLSMAIIEGEMPEGVGECAGFKDKPLKILYFLSPK
jgi:hypothetical protein